MEETGGGAGGERAVTAEAQPWGQRIPRVCARSPRRALCLLPAPSRCDASIPPLSPITARRDEGSVSSPAPSLRGPAVPPPTLFCSLFSLFSECFGAELSVNTAGRW